jgi:hypothetical protein
MEQSNRYELIYACYTTGQISERQWADHLKDEVFAAWVKKQQQKKAA